MFESAFKNFNINFNALNERNAVSSGDILTGHVTFELTKETKITSITMKLTGKASVHWTGGGGGGGGGRRRRRRTRPLEATLDFFNIRSVVVRENRAKLPPGTHVYPFTCQVPRGDFPSTFHGVHGKIVYTLTICINRPWHMSKDFMTVLNFISHINTNQPELWAPLSGCNSTTLCCLWCASGPTEFRATVEKKAFTPGETVKIICDISNASYRTATPKVKLVQKQIFYTHNKEEKKIEVKNLASETGRPIGAHTSGVHTEIMITIPPSASFTISNCSILQVDYIIEATLSITAGDDLTVIFPIILCVIPTYNNPHP